LANPKRPSAGPIGCLHDDVAADGPDPVAGAVVKTTSFPVDLTPAEFPLGSSREQDALGSRRGPNGGSGASALPALDFS
jgi:hypothetical protein